MNTSEKTDMIVAALLESQREIGKVQKGGRNEHARYDYMRLEDVVDASKAILNKHGIVVITSSDKVSELAPTEKMRRVSVTGSTRFAHTSGQWIEVGIAGEGADTQDKGTYKAITGARKYGLSAALMLATTDDPEGDNKGDDIAPKKMMLEIDPEKATPSDCTKEINRLRREHGIKAENVKAWIKEQGYHELAGMSPEERVKLFQAIMDGEI